MKLIYRFLVSIGALAIVYIFLYSLNGDLKPRSEFLQTTEPHKQISGRKQWHRFTESSGLNGSYTSLNGAKLGIPVGRTSKVPITLRPITSNKISKVSVSNSATNISRRYDTLRQDHYSKILEKWRKQRNEWQNKTRALPEGRGQHEYINAVKRWQRQNKRKETGVRTLFNRQLPVHELPGRPQLPVHELPRIPLTYKRAFGVRHRLNGIPALVATHNGDINLGNVSFLNEYKNPCWRDRNHVLRCLPYMFLAGTTKSGSTDFYVTLTRHPQFAKPEKKEINWIQNRFEGGRYQASLLAYLKNFYVAKTRIENESILVNGTTFHPLITGDFSVLYSIRCNYWKILPENKGKTEPLRTNAHFIHQLNPKAKILFLLRNPISRLYSDYLYSRQEFPSTSVTDFDARVSRDVLHVAECLRTNTARKCVFDKALYNEFQKRIVVGLYEVFIQEFLAVFPRDQILVIRLEDYADKFSETMTTVFKFLGIDELSNAELTRIQNHKKMNVSGRKKNAQPMLNDTINKLYGFYKPYNTKLAKILQDEKFNYGKENLL